MGEPWRPHSDGSTPEISTERRNGSPRGNSKSSGGWGSASSESSHVSQLWPRRVYPVQTNRPTEERVQPIGVEVLRLWQAERVRRDERGMEGRSGEEPRTQTRQRWPVKTKVGGEEGGEGSPFFSSFVLIAIYLPPPLPPPCLPICVPPCLQSSIPSRSPPDPPCAICRGSGAVRCDRCCGKGEGDIA